MYYAQCGEDINLRKFFPDKQDGFYIDVGVWEHQVDSVTKHFYDVGWRGINIEPIPDLYNAIVPHRPRDINLQLAAGASNTTRVINYVHGSGLSTFVDDNAKLEHNAHRKVEKIYVQQLTLERICELFLPPRQRIDFLKIDVEGAEYHVLFGANFTRFRPKVILYEATVPGTSGKDAIMAPDVESCDALLRRAFYEYVDFDGLNKWYVDSSWEGRPGASKQ